MLLHERVLRGGHGGALAIAVLLGLRDAVLELLRRLVDHVLHLPHHVIGAPIDDVTHHVQVARASGVAHEYITPPVKQL
eukprot:9095610-Alexandrium_andersonii.AAC.2